MLLKKFAFFILMALSSQVSFAVDAEQLKLFEVEYDRYTVLATKAEWEESLPHAKRAYELGLELYDVGHKNTAALAHNYGTSLVKTRQTEEGVKMFLEALDYYEAAYGDESVELAPLLMDLTENLPRSAKSSSRTKYVKRALKLTKTKYGEQSAEYGKISVRAGVILMHKGRYKVAKQYLLKGYKILVATRGEADEATAYAAFNLGKHSMSVRSNKQAVEYFQTALETFEDPGKPSNGMQLATHGFLVSAYEKLGKSDLSTEHCLAIGRMTPMTDTQDYQPLFKQSPAYPMAAARLRATGYVIVEYDVDEMGFVRNPKVVESEGHNSLINASIEAAKGFRYAPAFVDGSSVVTPGVRNKFVYTLN